MTPSAGVASSQKPPFTEVPAPASVATTASAVSGMPLSRSTNRMSSAMPFLATICFRLAAVLRGGA
jgi:hypothetical protein